MKWAPNKKLHFEVAIIKAIQSLRQATLDEVIEKLGELRDGKAVSEKESPSVAAGVRAARKPSEGGSPSSQNLAADTAATTATRVAETAMLDADELWQKVVAKIPTKGFLRTLTESIRPIGIDGRNFLLGHAPDDKSKVEALASANNRRQLEMLLKEATGRVWSVQFVAREGIVPSGDSSSDSWTLAESF